MIDSGLRGRGGAAFPPASSGRPCCAHRPAEVRGLQCRRGRLRHLLRPHDHGRRSLHADRRHDHRRLSRWRPRATSTCAPNIRTRLPR
jgi:hypothetical protein